MKRTILLVAAVALALVALAACDSSTRRGGAGTRITVTATEFKFEPATLTVGRGETINLTVKNTGAIEHTWVFKAVGFKMTVGPGKAETKTFTAPTAPGTYDIDCDVAGHKDAGMSGKLVVK